MKPRLGSRPFDRGGKSVRMAEEARLLPPRVERIAEEIRDVEAIVRRAGWRSKAVSGWKASNMLNGALRHFAG